MVWLTLMMPPDKLGEPVPLDRHLPRDCLLRLGDLDVDAVPGAPGPGRAESGRGDLTPVPRRTARPTSAG
jgi:hypothetical protein